MKLSIYATKYTVPAFTVPAFTVAAFTFPTSKQKKTVKIYRILALADDYAENPFSAAFYERTYDYD